MAKVLKGKEVADALTERMRQDVEKLKEAGIWPTLCIVRVGARPDDLAYERGAMKRAQAAGVEVINVVLPEDVSQEEFDWAMEQVGADDSIHGILLFRPLPEHLDGERARMMIPPQKDIDGCTDLSLAGVFTNTKTGFPPCTAQAAMEILHHFGIQISGKKAAVIGRSLVIGRPVAMMLMHENATVVNCHTRTVDVPSITREADILIAASGQLRSVTKQFTNPDQVVIDVGINWDEEKGAIAGDVAFDEVEPFVQAITPVPGGVGSVTSSVLISHVVEAAKRAQAASDGAGESAEGVPEDQMDMEMLRDAVMRGERTVVFGRYPKEPGGEVMPLFWRVLKVDELSVLLITRDLIDAQPYNETREDVTWETCTLRRWMNEVFIREAFDEEERKGILLTELYTSENKSWYTSGGNATQDRIFALSIDEAERYFLDNDDRLAVVTPYAESRGAVLWPVGSVDESGRSKDGRKVGLWWLRSPGCDNNHAVDVHRIGAIDRHGPDVDCADVSVRPALWLSLYPEFC